MKSLPARPSLESLRKEAKKLARDRSQSLREAQLAIAREYGFAGWQDLTAEVGKRLGNELEWAVAQAKRVIHDNDVERLKQLLAQYPALLSWQDKDFSWDGKDGLLGVATGAYGAANTPEREEWFTRGAAAEVLIDAGAVVVPEVCEGILRSGAKGLLELFHRKDLLPRTLKFFAALGDLDAVRVGLERVNDLSIVTEAFVRACGFGHEAVASLLLDRAIALDPELGKRIDESVGRHGFVKYFIARNASNAIAVGLWKAFVMAEASHALVPDANLPAFESVLKREPWLLGDDYVDFQKNLIETASFNVDRERFIVALLDREPALLRRQPPPPSPAISYALTYANAHLIPLLTRIWPLPDDLAHAAGMGNLPRVKQWFDKAGAPALGDLSRHYPCNDPHAQENDDLRWGAPTAQHVLDTALAWAVINRNFDVASFLLDHGADVNTNWNSHEPASILHHLVFLPNPYESMQFLIDHGIDMSIKDYRWDATAQGWAFYAAKDEKMAKWLEDEERKRATR